MAKNRSMVAKNLKAKKCAMQDFLINDNHRLAGGSWVTSVLKFQIAHKPYSKNQANIL